VSLTGLRSGKQPENHAPRCIEPVQIERELFEQQCPYSNYR